MLLARMPAPLRPVRHASIHAADDSRRQSKKQMGISTEAFLLEEC